MSRNIRVDRDMLRDSSGSPWLMLGVATVGFAVNFWAWALLSPLGPGFKEALGLSAFQQALLVAVPVVVGSVGRIPVGALTDRYGGRVMFPLVSLSTGRDVETTTSNTKVQEDTMTTT